MLLALEIVFTDDNPDKGTETISDLFKLITNPSLQMITPIRGRKHFLTFLYLYSFILFTDDNPDKGTETISDLFKLITNPSLQMITPIRGRKHISCGDEYSSTLQQFTDDNPDKGTETVINFSEL